MHRPVAKFVPRLLTDEQKNENRITIDEKLFDYLNVDEDVLKNVTKVMKYGFMATISKIKKGSHYSGLGRNRLDQKSPSESL